MESFVCVLGSSGLSMLSSVLLDFAAFLIPRAKSGSEMVGI